MRNVRTALVIALLATTIPAIALAQGGNRQATGQPNFGTLISSMNNTAAEMTELNELKNLTATNVRVVNIEDLLKGNNVEAFNNALNRNKAETAKLTSALNGNKVLTDYLKTNNIAVSRVVAIDVSGGVVTLFVQPVAVK
jgi:hypothetical protein